MTPESLRSAECGKELAQALELNKRVVPVLRQEPNGSPVPEELANINWVKLRDDDDFDAGVDHLVEALDKDFEWVHEHTRLGLRAAEWIARGRQRSYVLRGDDLRAAERFLTSAAGKQPEPTAEQLEYVAASRAAARSFNHRLLASVTVALVVAIALSVIAFIERSAAQASQQRAYSRQLAADAETQLGVDPELSLLLAAKAYDVNPTAQSVDVLRQALVGSDIRMAVRPADGVSQAAMTPDGHTLITAGRRDGAVRLWRYPGAKLLARLAGVDAARGQLSINPLDGRILLVDRTTGQARVFTGSRATLPPLGAGVTAAAWGGRGRYIVTGSRDGTVAVWNALSGAEVSHAPAVDGPVVAVALGAGPRVLAAVGASGITRLYNFATNRDFQLATECGRGGGQVLISPDESRLLTFGDGGNCPAILWNTATASQVGNLASWASANAAAFAPDSQRLVIASEAAVVLNPRNGSQIGQYVAHAGNVNAVAMAPAGDAAPAAGDVATGGEDGTIRIWDSSIPADTATTVLRANATSIASLSFAAGGSELVSVDGDGSAARVWSTGAPEPAVLGNPLVSSIGALAPDGRLALGDAGDGSIGVFSPQSARELVSLAGSRGFDTAATAGDAAGGLTANGRVAYVLGVHGLGAWRTTNGSRLPLPDFAGDRVGAVVAASAAPRLVAALRPRAGGAPRVVAIDPLAGSASPVATMRPGAMAVDPMGRRVVLAAGRLARVVDLRSGRTSALRLRGGRDPATLVALSADGRRAAIAGGDFVDVFDLADGRLVAEPPAARTAPVTAVALSRDGALVAAGYRDVRAWVWSVAGGEQVVAVKATKQAYQAGAGITALQISDGGNFLLTGVPLNDTTIWDIASGGRLYDFSGDFAGWSTDSRTVLTTGGPLEAWSCDACAPPPVLRKLARARVTRGFTPSERAKFLVQ